MFRTLQARSTGSASSSSLRESNSPNTEPTRGNSPITASLQAPSTPTHSKNPDDETEVCFGSLQRIRVLLKWQPKSDDPRSDCGTIYQSPETSFRIFNLKFHDGYALVCTQAGDDIGLLEERALRHLPPLTTSAEPVRYEVTIPEQSWQEGLHLLSTKGRNDAPIVVEVDVFGPRMMSQNVGSSLGRGGLFLQRPSRDLPLPYENPQCLDIAKFTSVEFGRSLHQKPTSCTYAKRKTDAGPRQIDEPDEDDAALDLDFIMASVLLTTTYDGNVRVDPRIKTPLLEHQRTGHKFILQRETGHIYEALWEPVQSDNEDVNLGYRHAITGARSRTAPDARGGILADDMGLGKSLTMLSVILGSRDEAMGFCTENASRSNVETDIAPNDKAPLFSYATLIVVPSELLLVNWSDEIYRHVYTATVRFCKYHGKDRPTDPIELSQHEIVLTTYGTVAADVSRRRDILHKIRWYRVVLDEAHIIRNCSTKQFEAVNRIQSHIRWCMTGTPIQNSLDDLGALIRYLKVPILGDPTSFRRHIIAPAAPTTGKDWRRPDFASLRLLLGAVCLRRTQAILSFRSRSVVTRLAFTEDEWGDYKTLEVVCKEALRMMVNSNSLRGKAAQENVLQKLLRLREFCNGIVDGDFTSPDAILRRLQQQGEVQCEYCSAAIHELESESDTVKGVQVTECHRFICTTCAPLYRVEAGNAETDKSACQFCGVRHRASNLMAKGPLPGVETVRRSPAKYPSKLLALLADVEKHVGQEKCIVFSVWKRTLDLAQGLFTANGIHYGRVDGSISTTSQRRRILFDFQRNPEMRVLLMTLGTGAVGLNNLSVASHVYLLEPQWNPSVEKQAIGRVLRMGQESEVVITRYIMEKSIEDIVEGCQKYKQRLASGGFQFVKVVKDRFLDN